LDKLKLHEQLSVDVQIGQKKNNVVGEDESDKQLTTGEQTAHSLNFELHGAGSSGEQKNVEGEFDKLNLHEQADEQIGQAHNFDTHDAASSEGEFERLQLREQFSAGDQVGKADSFDINDAASLGEQKDVGREAANGQWHSLGFCAPARPGATCPSDTAIGTQSLCALHAGARSTCGTRHLKPFVESMACSSSAGGPRLAISPGWPARTTIISRSSAWLAPACISSI
jgi:hypothetical protein